MNPGENEGLFMAQPDENMHYQFRVNHVLASSSSRSFGLSTIVRKDDASAAASREVNRAAHLVDDALDLGSLI